MQNHAVSLSIWVLVLLGWVGGGTLTIQAFPLPETPKTVAVLAFDNNTGQPKYDHMGRGLASMMISDLSVLESLQLVEREHIQQVIDELNFQQTAYVDSTTAQQVGLFVGAEYVVTGALIAFGEKMRLDTRVVRVETGEIVKTAEVTGDEGKFFDLQKRLAKTLIDGLEIALSPEDQALLEKQQEANRIAEAETAVAYSEALYYLDTENYAEALIRMNTVREKAPGSAIVKLTQDYLEQQLKEEAKRKAKEKGNEVLRKKLPKIKL